MKHSHWIRAACTAVFLILIMPAAAASETSIEIDEELQQQMRSAESMSYAIFLRERPDLGPAYAMSWEERGHFVAEALRQTAERSQAQVRAYLKDSGADYQSFWIDNVIVVEQSSRATFDGLLQFGEIAALRADPNMALVEPEETAVASGRSTGVEPNLTHVLAPEVWNMGYHGEGMVVASIDTGVRHTHDSLVNQYRGHLGNGQFDHSYNWWDPAGGSAEPVDDVFHGTHTIGTMVGDDGAGNRTGIAPQAQWMACRACTSGGCPGSALLECAQFVAAPWDENQENVDPGKRPHVVNNSWGGCGRSYDPWFQDVVDAWHAAGVVPVFSNGNSSNCGYSSPPGCNTAGNPGRYANVLGIGSTGTNNGQYAAHSNWGPTDDPWNDNPLGSPSIKPNVSAPGVSIRAAVHTGDSDYGFSTGTSMSAPHVAGLVALMWQAAPCLAGDYVSTAELLMANATEIPYPTQCGGEGPGDVPNNATGWGEIDALATVNAAIGVCGAQFLAGKITRSDTNAAVDGATVAVSGPITKEVLTDANGDYEIGVAPGTYDVTVSGVGYATETVTGVEVAELEAHVLDVVVDPASVVAVTPDFMRLEATLRDTTADTLTIDNPGNANLEWAVATDEPTATRSAHDPDLDEQFAFPDFGLDSPANGGEPISFAFQGGVDNRGRVTGFSFNGTASGITGNPVRASDTCLVVEAPDGETYAIGGADGTYPGCTDHAWDFQGADSGDDGLYPSAHETAFDPVVNDAGEWKFTFLNDWDDAGSATIAWSGVTITLHKTPLPICDDMTEVPWVTVDPAQGVIVPGSGDDVSVTVDTSELMPGIYEAGLCVTTNDPKEPLVPVPLTLTVNDPPIGVLGTDGSTLDFGDVPVGHSQAGSAVVTNTAGSDPTMIEVSAIDLAAGTVFEVVGGSCQAGETTLLTGDSCSVDIRFSPDALELTGGVLIVDSEDGQQITVDVIGTGIEPPDEIFVDGFQGSM